MYLNRTRANVAALVCVLSLGSVLTVEQEPAHAATRTICTGFSTCSAAGKSNHGYSKVYKHRPGSWNMDPGHNCTNYVAYMMIRAGVKTRPAALVSGNSDAWNWGHELSSKTDHTPKVGSIAWWDKNKGRGGDGHVAYVESVGSNGSIVTSDDVYGGDFHWRSYARTDRYPTGFIHIKDAATQPKFTADAPSNGITGEPYAYTFKASGKPKPTFSVSSGALPSGLSLSRKGRLTGTPSSVGAYDFHVKARHAAGAATKHLRLTVANSRATPFPLAWHEVSGDFNGDGYGDTVAMYDYGNNRVKLWTFAGSATGATAPTLTWDSGPGNWNWNWHKAELTATDYNKDGKTDLGAFYNYGDAGTKLWTFVGSATGLTAPALTWNSGPGNWQWDRIQTQSGDFNGDGYGDTVAMYDYGNSQVKLWTFAGSPTGASAPTMSWDSGAGTWNWHDAELTATDYNKDGKTDLGAFYNYGADGVKLWTFPGSPTGLTAPTLTWNSGPGNWQWDRIQTQSGDFNGDGYGDTVAMYDYGNHQVKLWTFAGSATGATAPTLTWDSSPGSWTWQKVKLAATDYNKDGKADLGAFYDYGSKGVELWTFPGTTNGLGAPTVAWNSTQWQWDRF